MLPQREPAGQPVMTDDGRVELVHREASASGILHDADPVRAFLPCEDYGRMAVDFLPDTVNVRYDERLTTVGLRWRVWGITLHGFRTDAPGNPHKRVQRTFELDDADLPTAALAFALDAQPDPHGYAIHAPGCQHCA